MLEMITFTKDGLKTVELDRDRVRVLASIGQSDAKMALFVEDLKKAGVSTEKKLDAIIKFLKSDY